MNDPVLCRHLLILAFAFLFCGCAPQVPRGTVAGTVTFQGKPVTHGTILFEDPSAGIAITAELGPDGSYVVETYEAAGLPVGTYQVAVTPHSYAVVEDFPLAGAAPPPSSENESVTIPSKFHSTATSGLSVTVKEGENPPFDFDLAK